MLSFARYTDSHRGDHRAVLRSFLSRVRLINHLLCAASSCAIDIMSGERSYLASLDVIGPTIEAVTLNAISGMLAQAFNAYKAKVGARLLRRLEHVRMSADSC